jgi:hypothetical protein
VKPVDIVGINLSQGISEIEVEPGLLQGILHLVLESPSKRIRQSFRIDVKKHKLVKTSAPTFTGVAHAQNPH